MVWKESLNDTYNELAIISTTLFPELIFSYLSVIVYIQMHEEIVIWVGSYHIIHR